MKYRNTLVGFAAAATLLGTAGIAQAHHLHEGDYSTCRDGQDQHHLGYSDEGTRDDPARELPTIYANGNPETREGNIGICSGNRYGTENQEPVRSLEIGNDSGGIYVAGQSPESDDLLGAIGMSGATPLAETDEGSVNVGDDYVEVDGAEGNQASQNHPYLDGYLSVGANDAGDGVEVCAGGDFNHEYYEVYEGHDNYGEKSCNEQLLEDGARELGLSAG